MTYSEKLKNPKWQKKRLRILERDDFACTLCGDNETELHIHHTYYERGKKPHEYEDDSLKTLCCHCHMVVEYYKSQYPIHSILITAKKNLTDQINITCYSRNNKTGKLICKYLNILGTDITDITEYWTFTEYMVEDIFKTFTLLKNDQNG